MKIVFVLPDLGAGGAERVVTILSKAFAQRGIAVDIVLFLSDRIQYEVPEGVRLIRMKARELTKMERIRRLRAYFLQQRQRHERLAVIPFHDTCLKHAWTAALGLGIPVVACERNDPYQKGRTGLARLKAMLPYMLANRCVFQTPDAQAYYGKAVEKKSRVIMNPLVLPEDIRWRGMESCTIVSVGRLEPQKNQKMLIDAFALLHVRMPEYTLDIYGEGCLREQLQAQIDALGLHDAVTLRGHAGDIHQRLSDAALFVLSSDYEGMSNALIEALAIGVPVVSTDHPIGGARMLIDHDVNGLMTPVGDAAAMADAMEALLRNPQKAKQLSAKGTEVRRQLAVNSIASQWIEMICEMNG